MLFRSISQRNATGIYFALLIGLFLLPLLANSQVREIGKLPSELDECSGLEALDSGLFITHNDGGDGPNLYVIDTTPDIRRVAHLKGIKNNDWEDITQAPDGTIYVGDFGNNDNKRKDLAIHIIQPYSQWNSDSLEVETITFRYGDQNHFPPGKGNLNFDCEAMVWYRDSLHIFSKNWTGPFTGYAKHYVLPAIPGDYVVSPVDSIHLGTIPLISWVTAADVYNDTLYMLGTAYMWKINFVSGRLDKALERIVLQHATQKEGICIHNGAIFMTDESNGGFGFLYEYKSPGNSGMEEVNHIPEIRIVNTHGEIALRFSGGAAGSCVVLSDMLGRSWSCNLYADHVVQLSEQIPEFEILRSGIYGLRIVTIDGRAWSQKLFYEKE